VEVVLTAEHRLVIEVDGYGYHNTRRRFESDRRRDAKLAATQIQVIRYTKYRILNEPQEVIAEVRRLTRPRA
jgi:very-short-patch-repair endonuclease